MGGPTETSGPPGRKLMHETHKGHRIMVSALRLAGPPQWKPCLTIVWSEDGHGRVSKLSPDLAFRVRQKAEMEGLKFAKKWIDDGKPDLSLDPASDTKETSDVTTTYA